MSKRVLVVDDEEAARKYISTILKENGYEALVAQDGVEGLDKAVKEKPDLIILDLMMPKKNGFSVLQNLKSSSDLKDIPVIISSQVDNFIKQLREEINNEVTLKKMEALLDNIDSKVEKFFLRFRSYRKVLLDERESLIEKYKRRGEAIPAYLALPDYFVNKPVDPEDFIQAVNDLIGAAE